MNAFSRHFAYDFRSGLRDKSLLLLNYLFPLGFYILMGLLMTGLNPNYAPTMIPASILVAMMAGALLGLPNPLVESRDSGIYRSFKINGVPAISIITIPVLTSMVHILLVSIIITVTAGPLFHAGIPTSWGNFVLVFVITAFNMASLGVLIGVVSPNSRAIVLFSQSIFLPSMILGGLMVPSEMLSPVLYRISLLLPTTHAINAWRGMAFSMSAIMDPRWSLLVLLASGVIAYGLAIYLFNWDSQNRQAGRSAWLGLLALAPFILAVIFLVR